MQNMSKSSYLSLPCHNHTALNEMLQLLASLSPLRQPFASFTRDFLPSICFAFRWTPLCFLPGPTFLAPTGVFPPCPTRMTSQDVDSSRPQAEQMPGYTNFQPNVPLSLNSSVPKRLSPYAIRNIWPHFLFNGTLWTRSPHIHVRLKMHGHDRVVQLAH